MFKFLWQLLTGSSNTTIGSRRIYQSTRESSGTNARGTFSVEPLDLDDLPTHELPTHTVRRSPSAELHTNDGEPESLDCPSCGGPLEIDFIDQHRADKAANCPYCQRTVDLPDPANANSLFRTRERVIERPNERIVERVSQWSRHSSTELDSPGDWRSKADGLVSTLLESGCQEPIIIRGDKNSDQEWEFLGKEFSSREEFLDHVRQNFPGEMADRMLDLMDRAKG